MTSIFKALKALMEEQQSIQFTIDEENETFTCDQFDAEIVLAVGDLYRDNDTAHVHRILGRRNHEISTPLLELILNHVFLNLFSPIHCYRLNRSSIDVFLHDDDDEKFIKIMNKSQNVHQLRKKWSYNGVQGAENELNLDFSDLYAEYYAVYSL
jgi:hypothetical protein